MKIKTILDAPLNELLTFHCHSLGIIPKSEEVYKTRRVPEGLELLIKKSKENNNEE